MGSQPSATAIKLGHGVCTRPVQCDDGREVHLVDVYQEGSKVSLAVKYWDQDRLGGNTAQVSKQTMASTWLLADALHSHVVTAGRAARQGWQHLPYGLTPCCGVAATAVALRRFSMSCVPVCRPSTTPSTLCCLCTSAAAGRAA
jgi:hypothetical protein